MPESKYREFVGKRVDVERTGGLPPYHATLTKLTEDGLLLTFSEGFAVTCPEAEVARVTLETAAPVQRPATARGPEGGRIPADAHHVTLPKRG